jgi:hypothetical protein
MSTGRLVSGPECPLINRVKPYLRATNATGKRRIAAVKQTQAQRCGGFIFEEAGRSITKQSTPPRSSLMRTL